MKHTREAMAAAKVLMNGRRMIATEYGNKTAEGVADLIERETAAPELLEAVRALKGVVEDHALEDGAFALRLAVAAIAKAEGREP